MENEQNPAEEQTPAAQPDANAAPAADAPQPDASAPASSAPFTLELPSYLPTKEITDERLADLKAWGVAAPAAGVPQLEAQSLIDAAADVANGIGHLHDVEDADGAMHYMQSAWGPELTGEVLGKARAYVKSKGGDDGKLAQYLADTGLGNSPSCLVAMAFAQEGLFTLTPAQAQAELDAILADTKDAYHNYSSKRHTLAVARVQMLSRIAHRETNDQAPAQQATAPDTQKAESAAKVAAQAKIKELLADKKHPLNISGHRDHDKAVAEYQKLLEQL